MLETPGPKSFLLGVFNQSFGEKYHMMKKKIKLAKEDNLCFNYDVVAINYMFGNK